MWLYALEKILVQIKDLSWQLQNGLFQELIINESKNPLSPNSLFLTPNIDL
jgi:hypothetical protein